MLQKTYKYFNQSTRQAFFERVKGYVGKSYDENKKSNVPINPDQKIYRFDLGENILGSSPVIYQFLERLKNTSVDDIQLNNYPEVIHKRIRTRIAERHRVDPNWVVISTGLDAILDLITRVFFDPKDYYVSLIPSFYLFEAYSERMGALPIFIELNEANDFKLTRDKVEELKTQIIKFKPKVVWIANPNNPTGSVISADVLEEILQVAAVNNSFVVVDEAYIEFLPKYGEKSAMQFVNEYSNLMVLRTFSKAYGLAGMRIGYLISSCQDIVDAMLMLRTHFPVTQLAINMASLALNDRSFLENTRKQTKRFSQDLFTNLGTLKSFKHIPTSTNIFLLKNIYLPAKELDRKLREYNIFTAYVNVPTHDNNQYVRVTVRNSEDNEYLFEACKQIDNDIVININSYYKSKFKQLPIYNTEYIKHEKQKTIFL